MLRRTAVVPSVVNAADMVLDQPPRKVVWKGSVLVTQQQHRTRNTAPEHGARDEEPRRGLFIWRLCFILHRMTHSRRLTTLGCWATYTSTFLLHPVLLCSQTKHRHASLGYRQQAPHRTPPFTRVTLFSPSPVQYTYDNGWKYEFWLKSEKRIVYGTLSRSLSGCAMCLFAWAR